MPTETDTIDAKPTMVTYNSENEAAYGLQLLKLQDPAPEELTVVPTSSALEVAWREANDITEEKPNV